LARSELDALPLESLGEISCVCEQWAIPSFTPRIRWHLSANPDPLRRFADQCIGDEKHSGERIAHLVRRGLGGAQFNAERGTAIFSDRKLRKGEAVIPLQEAPIRGTKAIAERWRKVRPDHQRAAWASVMDQTDAQPAPNVPV